jgi:hypothetical protein
MKMRVRKVQRLDEEGAWFDDCYAFENSEGDVVFRYNLAWGRVGAACNVKIREGDTPLEEVESVIPPGDALRWLPVEVVPDEEAAAFMEALDEVCDIPRPRGVKIGSPARLGQRAND